MKEHFIHRHMLKYAVVFLFLFNHDLIAQIQMPIEVIGSNFTVDSREFNISNPAEARYLYLLVNNFSAEHKVQFKLNSDANWTSLTNDNTWSDTQGEAFGGIGGGYSTIKIYTDLTNNAEISSLLNGTNTIYFRFNNQNDNISSGYRIVAFNILSSTDSSPLIANSDFVYDDPTNWQPIHSSSEAINAGKDLWHNAPLIDSEKNPIVINAKCSSCHAVDGQDLKYFNYSNRSIIERSKFHGLSQIEAEQVASYIRSLDVQAPATARPWNPPYQPGPGLDSKPASEWSAGAGLEAVLENDADMLEYLFPNGTSDAALNDVFDLKGTLNIREMPIALQFPDWNRWLPRIHPLDMLPASAYDDIITGIGGVFGRTAGQYGYQVVKQNIESNGIESYNDGNGKDLLRILGELGAGVQDFLYKGFFSSLGNFWWTITDSPGIRLRNDGLLVEELKVNLAKWNAVKHWEIIQEYGIEGMQPHNVENAEARQWPVNNWTVFAIAPHIVGDNRGQSKFVNQDPVLGMYESTAWYQLQMTLNAGMRTPQNVAPVDWSYNFDHVTKSGILTGHKEPLRLVQNFLKAYQQRDNMINANGNPLVNQSAWNMREVSPWRLYSTAKGNTSIHDELDNYTPGLKVKLMSKLLKVFMDKADLLDVSDWPRSNDGVWHKLQPDNYVPSNNSEANCLFPNANGRGNCSDIQNAVEADAMFVLIPLFQEIGMKCDQVERLRVWSEMMWPLGDWAQFNDNCVVLSINDDQPEHYLTVYPVPAEEILNLSKKDEWTLYDMTGQKIMTGNSKEIDLSNLQSSTYFLHTTNGVKKIIKK